MKKFLFPLLFLMAPVMAQTTFTLTSPDITPDKPLKDAQAYNGFGCSGQNISPALTWKNPPLGTKSFALMVHDPDAPTGGSGWWHWVVVNLPNTANHLPAGAGKVDGSLLPPSARQINTDFGEPSYGGPCPPVGDPPHHYRFTIYALKVATLELPANATAALAGFMIKANSLGAATVTGLYSRAK